MKSRYVYQQFGVWWVFTESTMPGPIQLSGPYPSREAAEEALAMVSATPLHALQAAQ